MILQLNPTIWLKTPKGTGLCHFVIDYGEEHDLLWVVADDAACEIWTWSNMKVRLIKNISLDIAARYEKRDGEEVRAATLFVEKPKRRKGNIVMGKLRGGLAAWVKKHGGKKKAAKVAAAKRKKRR